MASLPSADFDGTDTAEFIAHALGAPDQWDEQPSKLLQIDEEDGDDGRLEQEMKVTFYHCNSGNYWNYTGGNKTMECDLCTNIEDGAEVMDMPCVPCSVKLRLCVPYKQIIYFVSSYIYKSFQYIIFILWVLRVFCGSYIVHITLVWGWPKKGTPLRFRAKKGDSPHFYFYTTYVDCCVSFFGPKP